MSETPKRYREVWWMQAGSILTHRDVRCCPGIASSIQKVRDMVLRIVGPSTVFIPLENAEGGSIDSGGPLHAVVPL